MDFVQIIHTPKGEQLVVLPKKDYDRLMRAARLVETNDDAADLALGNARKKLAQKAVGNLIPQEVMRAIVLEDCHPVRAWRHYKKLTADQLAQKSNMTRSALTMIETRQRKGTVAVYKALAKALGVGVGWLMDD